MSTPRLGRARTQSLCGTARGIASRKAASELRAREAAAVPSRGDLELPEQPGLFAAHGGAARLIGRAGFVPVTPKCWLVRVDRRHVRLMKHLLCASLLLVVASLSVAADNAGDWPNYGRDARRRSPFAADADRSRQRLGLDAGLGIQDRRGAASKTGNPIALEATPLVVDGMMYLSTPLGQVIALDPVSGKRPLARDDDGVKRERHFGDWVSRGVSLLARFARANAGAPCARRVIVGDDRRAPGRARRRHGRDPARASAPAASSISSRGLRDKQSFGDEYEQTSPPAVVGDLDRRGLRHRGQQRDRRARAAKCAASMRARGALRWTWDPVPQDPADPAYDTWRGAGAHAHRRRQHVVHHRGGSRARSRVPADDEPGRRTTAAATRLGDNRYANSLVALRASTGKLVWHFQTVHHDLWDYDNASPPVLDDTAGRQPTRPCSRAPRPRSSSCWIAPPASRCFPSRNARCRRATCRARRPRADAAVLERCGPGFRTLTAADIWGATPEDLRGMPRAFRDAALRRRRSRRRPGAAR